MKSITLNQVSSLLNKAAYEGGKAYDRLLDKRVVLGVTGLSGSGKSSFITSLVYQLINFQHATLPSFSPITQGRFMGCSLKNITTGEALFDYDSAIDALASAEPRWPVSTVDYSHLLLEIRYRPRSTLFTRPGKQYRTLYLEIRDYPGEWLVDLPLVTQSFYNWSRECHQLFNQQPRKDLLGNLLPLIESINPVSTLEPDKLLRVHAEYVKFLKLCKQQGLSLLQPGRFLLPSEGEIIEPFFPVIMAMNYDEKTLNKAKPGSWYAVMKKAYEDYVEKQVKPFHQHFFSDIDRQIILIDVLKTLNAGKASMEDLMVTMSRLLGIFEYGQNNIIQRLFSPKIDRVVIAASKIDQVLPAQHENVRALTAAIVREIYRKTSYEQVDVFTEALASVRCTEPVQREQTDYLIGVLDDGKAGLMRHPEIPAALPSDEQWNSFNDWKLRRLRPPLNPGLGQGDALPHVRMDTVIRELLGDKF